MPTSQNNKYKNVIHSQKLLLSNKDETISLLNERIEKLETQKELNELKQRIGELKKQNKQYEEDVIIKSNRLMDMIHKFDKQDEKIEKLEELYRRSRCVSIEATRDYLILQKVLFEEVGMTASIGQEHLPRNIGEQVSYLRHKVHTNYNDDIWDGVKQITQGFKNERAKENKS